MGKQWKQWLTLFLGGPKSLQMVTAAMKLKDTYSLEGKLVAWELVPSSLQGGLGDPSLCSHGALLYPIIYQSPPSRI